jgi:hypothetical protein
MVLSVADPNWSSIVNGNPDSGWVGIAQRVEDFVSAQVSPLVRATQIMATLAYIIFADSTIRDVVLGLELFSKFPTENTQ